MSKPDIKSFAKPKRADTRPDSVTVRSVSLTSGAQARVLATDANGPSFGDDFLYIFKQNVKKAREENKERLGSTGGGRKPR
jgi:hypothetical protein